MKLFKNSFFLKGSYVNFTCNSFYEPQGPNQVFCKNGKWDINYFNCEISVNFCRDKPPIQFGQTMLKSLTRTEFKYELSYTNSDKIIAYSSASYICINNFTFQDMTDVVERNFNGTILKYKSITCVGRKRWGNIPVCLKP